MPIQRYMAIVDGENVPAWHNPTTGETGYGHGPQETSPSPPVASGSRATNQNPPQVRRQPRVTRTSVITEHHKLPRSIAESSTWYHGTYIPKDSSRRANFPGHPRVPLEQNSIVQHGLDPALKKTPEAPDPLFWTSRTPRQFANTDPITRDYLPEYKNRWANEVRGYISTQIKRNKDPQEAAKAKVEMEARHGKARQENWFGTVPETAVAHLRTREDVRTGFAKKQGRSPDDDNVKQHRYRFMTDEELRSRNTNPAGFHDCAMVTGRVSPSYLNSRSDPLRRERGLRVLQGELQRAVSPGVSLDSAEEYDDATGARSSPSDPEY